MPIATVKLRPGVNTQLSLASNEAGVSVSNLIRYKDQIVQKIGGWNQYYSQTITSTIREIHGWQDLSANQRLAIAATGTLTVVSAGAGSDITPQTRTSNFAPSFSVALNGNVVTVIDAGSSLSAYDSVYYNTPIAVGPLLINGAYKINTVGGSSTYTIISSNTSTAAVSSAGTLPTFTTVAADATVTVVLPNNNFPDTVGLLTSFIAPSSVGGITVEGAYQVNTIIDSTSFTITSPTQASSAGTVTMNSSLVQAVYYITQGPPPTSGGYGVGGYGLGGYGVGSPVAGGAGTPITATDWTLDNWGEALMACPKDGPIYIWAPRSGFTTASVISQAPFFNGGIFISMPQQILVAWRSTQSTGTQDPMIVRWSDAEDYTNWDITSGTAAGRFRIPTGSRIIGGLQGPSQGMIWTDVDAWAMQYVGGDVIFNFTRLGSGCGLIGPHAAGVIANTIYWCGNGFQFFRLGNQGVEPLQCTVWDFIFQNLNTTYQARVRCAPNSTFNEISWFFPSTNSAGENDSYVKYNILENEWDYGSLTRVAWIDVTALGTPIGADTGTIYQHEMGYNDVNQAISPVFESGYWSISEGSELAFVDWILPDMKFGTYSGAQTATCSITFKTVDYAGDTPTEYGPYEFTNATQYITTRLRGRFMSIRVESNDLNSFWRLGSVRYRWARSGRR